MGHLPLHLAGAQGELQLQEGVAPERGCDAPLPGLEGVRPCYSIDALQVHIRY